MIENIQTVRKSDPMMGIPEHMEPMVQVVHPLDAPEAIARLQKLEDWWFQARQALAMARYEMSLDRDFYDGLQWSEEDRQILEARGQVATVFNRIKASLDWIIGSEKRTRVDHKVLPRTDDDVNGADIKTKLLKYLGDVNKSSFSRSLAFADSTISGVGWLEDAIRSDPTEEALYSRYEDWRNIWWDHLAVQRDMSDARYVFRSKWTDVDIATAMFPDRATSIKAAAHSLSIYDASDEDEFYWLSGQTTTDGRQIGYQSSFDDAFNVDNRRDRVRLIECWYRMPANVKVMRGFPRTEGQIFKPGDEFHQELVQGGHVSLYDCLKMVVKCAMFLGSTTTSSGCLLQDIDSPYVHNRFPFTPIWCYRRGRDRMPYGVVRNLRDPQEDLNKRRSKALFILSSNGMIADEDAFEDWDDAIEELARPDRILKKKKGAEVELLNETTLVEEHIMLARDDAEYIQSVSGVTDENLGRQTNAVSGKAITARQNQGTLTTAEIFDNYRYSVQIQGEIDLALVEQFYDEEKIIRLTGPRGQAEFFAINQMVTDEYGQPQLMNDITATKADFLVSDQDFRESVRIAMFEAMMDLCGQLPAEITLQVLDMVVDLSDLPGKEELVKRIRSINGQQDPDEPEDSPEAMARQEAQAEQQGIEKQAMMNQLAEQEAKVKKLLAEVELLVEKVKTERFGRQVQQEQGVADERDKRFKRNIDTFQAAHKVGMEVDQRSLERERFDQEKKQAKADQAKPKPKSKGKK